MHHDQVRTGANSRERTRMFATPIIDTSKLLEKINAQQADEIRVKNKQIEALTENTKNTTAALAGLQRLLAPLLGAADPFRKPGTENEAGDSASRGA
jgi:hypothetical protein